MHSEKEAAMSSTAISPQNIDLGQVDLVLDVRTAMEHAEKHLALPHVHVPLDELAPAALMKRHKLGKTARVLVVCRAGGRAAKAAQMFADAGYTHVQVVSGGLEGCEACGYSLAGHAAGGNMVKNRLTLERQVRIAAGGMAAAGALAALLLHPLFALVPLAIGCGLVFAGVTNRCGLALVLTKAPWNQ
jgi:rhodanese-related sulfurtransferase